MTKATTLVAVAGIALGYLAVWFLTCVLTWLLWRYSVGGMVPWDLPLSVKRPDFIPYLCFWALVGVGIRSAGKLWREK